MQIRIDHHGEEAREARTRVTALAASLEDTREEYLALLEGEIRRILDQTDPAELTQTIADLVDAGAVVAYALGTSLAQEWDVDLGSLFRGVERFLEEKQPEEGGEEPRADAAGEPAGEPASGDGDEAPPSNGATPVAEP